mmetsp:Transcript_117199/g.328004  ORF Transcript_117199/g.328004 Transcript_117199/m.328004 type:complete len:203 (+) Transcript_117199:147-755(+)
MPLFVFFARTRSVRFHAGSTFSGSPISPRLIGGIHSPTCGKNQACSFAAMLGSHPSSFFETFPSITQSNTTRAHSTSTSWALHVCEACSATAMRDLLFFVVLSSNSGRRSSHATNSPQPPATAAMSGVSPLLPTCVNHRASKELRFAKRHGTDMSQEPAARTRRSAPMVLGLATRIAAAVAAKTAGHNNASRRALRAIAVRA